MNESTQLMLASGAGFVLSSFLGPKIIPLLQRLKIGQSIREDGPSSHLAKSGTPTMGGIIFLIAFVVATTIAVGLNADMGIIIVSTLGFGAVGFMDDYIKVVKKRNLGLRAYQKIIGQFVVAMILIHYYLNFSGSYPQILIPLLGEKNLTLGVLTIPFLLVVIIGTVNAVNLTDGLDGLATGVSVIVFGTFGLLSLRLGYVDAAVASFAMAGSLLGFLIYNYNPARIFMGDTGSLALGGALSAITLLSGTYIFILVIGGLFFAEALSVMIQVGYFKLTGKRFFRMAPLHHHYEQKGWKEIKVVWVFWATTLVLSLTGLFILS
ncbi:phospho-N-acetylmuramoyl-pentapeptide-transferase [Gudongella sp. SC589]|jgi:phospho-N-acetylmuramoyl-pentapeptide-transferase|uniref:phospho-N-acetylmuramoyl-pentapeptide- transferase n=1 Tax=Gudongella sp. SC589 TaxID=3385990 RepID=UPI003904C146